MTSVVLYTRPDCHLCDDARAMLERARARIPFALQERNIDEDDALLRRHLERIPVIEVDGKEAFELVIDEAELGAYLARVHSA
jgi:glutaredoxin